MRRKDAEVQDLASRRPAGRADGRLEGLTGGSRSAEESPEGDVEDKRKKSEMKYDFDDDSK